jgi:hypothetical protein
LRKEATAVKPSLPWLLHVQNAEGILCDRHLPRDCGPTIAAATRYWKLLQATIFRKSLISGRGKLHSAERQNFPRLVPRLHQFEFKAA